MDETGRVCPRCRKAVRSGFKVCVDCGEILRPPSLAELSGHKKKVKRITFARVFAAVVVLAFAVALLAYLTGWERCSKPSVRIGGECCVDGNGNNVCDKYERYETTTTVPQTTTTVTPETSTTTSTSTTTTSTTTTTVLIRCRVNADCGQKNESLVCFNDDVYVLRRSPKCVSPGKPDAYCVVVQNNFDTEHPKQRCSETCWEGECVSLLSLQKD